MLTELLSLLLLTLYTASQSVCQEIIDSNELDDSNLNQTDYKDILLEQELLDEHFIAVPNLDSSPKAINDDNLEGSGSDNGEKNITAFSEANCIEPEFNTICSGKGECIRGRCECRTDILKDENDNSTSFYRFSGKFCEECPYCRGQRCETFLPCAECKLLGKGGDCASVCRFEYVVGHPVVRNIDNDEKLCDIENSAGGCFFRFKYYYSEENEAFLEIDDKFTCFNGARILISLFWGVIFYIVGVIVLVPRLCSRSKCRREKTKTRSARLTSDVIRLSTLNVGQRE